MKPFFSNIGGARSFFFFLFLCFLNSISFSQSINSIRIEGNTMGTTYHVIYFDDGNRNFKFAIDSLLVLVNQAISVYDEHSDISKFNRSKHGIRIRPGYFTAVVRKALKVAELSEGAFDPTVMPLVNAWGFGPKRQGLGLPDSARIDSILQFVGYEKIRLSADSVCKTDSRVQLDFGGIGQGFGADVVADFLRKKGIKNFLVELGGEGISYGKNLESDTPWTIGILDPNSTRENQFYKAYARLADKAFTTSGNYFNYRVIGDKRFGHSIDPKSGYPVQRELLSASVFSDDCAYADAWATAFMVLGLHQSLEVLKKNSEIDALLIFNIENELNAVYVTSRMKNSIVIEHD